MATNRKHRMSRRNLIRFAGIGAIASAMGIGSASAETTRADKPIKLLVDFPDSDYGEVMMRHVDRFRGMNAELLMRRVAYIDRHEQIPETFTRVHLHEQRAKVIAQSAVVITPCVKTVTASIKAGAVPIYVRHDHSPHGVEKDMAEIGVDVVSLSGGDSLSKLVSQALA